LVAATLVVSLLSALIPLATASAIDLCTMACCAGKAPHLAGACSSGLMKTAKATHEPEILCGLHVRGDGASRFTATRQAPWEIIEADADDSDTGSCGSQHRDSLSQTTSSATTRSNTPHSSSIAAHSMNSPCGTDCRACSGSYIRQPKPRDRAMVERASLARPPSNSKWLHDFFCDHAARGDRYEQPSPRGPPKSRS
jgi:hypothetical protein